MTAGTLPSWFLSVGSPPGDRRPNSVTAPAHSIPEAPLAAGGWPRIWRPFRDSNKWQPDVLRGLLTPKNAVLSFLPW